MSVARKGSQSQSAQNDKAGGQQPKPALKAEDNYLNKYKGKGQARGKKIHFDVEAYEVYDGVGRRAGLSLSPYFDCTRHNVRRAWLKWRDAGASDQVLKWIRHNVSVPWLGGERPPPFNHESSCQHLPPD